MTKSIKEKLRLQQIKLAVENNKVEDIDSIVKLKLNTSITFFTNSLLDIPFLDAEDIKGEKSNRTGHFEYGMALTKHEHNINQQVKNKLMSDQELRVCLKSRIINILKQINIYNVKIKLDCFLELQDHELKLRIFSYLFIKDKLIGSLHIGFDEQYTIHSFINFSTPEKLIEEIKNNIDLFINNFKNIEHNFKPILEFEYKIQNIKGNRIFDSKKVINILNNNFIKNSVVKYSKACQDINRISEAKGYLHATKGLFLNFKIHDKIDIEFELPKISTLLYKVLSKKRGRLPPESIKIIDNTLKNRPSIPLIHEIAPNQYPDNIDHKNAIIEQLYKKGFFFDDIYSEYLENKDIQNLFIMNNMLLY